MILRGGDIRLSVRTEVIRAVTAASTRRSELLANSVIAHVSCCNANRPAPEPG